MPPSPATREENGMTSHRRYVLLPLAAILVLSIGTGTGFAASHREAPLTAADPQIDSTDLYAFVSPDAPDSVTLISNWIPFQESAGGPNFYPWAEGVRYNINIDNDGDAKADLTYRWEFKTVVRDPKTFLHNTGPVKSLRDKTLNVYQTYTLKEIDESGKSKTLVADGISAPSNVGAASMPDYASLRREAVTDIRGGGKSFAGQADDSFFLDLRVFDLLYGTDLKEAGNDTLNGYNVSSLAIQVPKADVAKGGDATANPIIGVWTTAERQRVRTQSAKGTPAFSGEYVQVSRLGQPLVNEVVAPIGAKDLFNGSKPQDDAQFLPAVQDPEVPKLLQLIYKIDAPATPRKDLVEVFLTGIKGLNQPAKVTPSEQLRLNMSIPVSASPNRLGVLGADKAGFPNGRRLNDDVVDIALRAMAGAVLGVKTELGDGVDKNDVAFESTFPYVALPHSGSVVNTSAAGSTSATDTIGARKTASTRSDGVSTPMAVAMGAAGLVLGMIIMSMIRRKPDMGGHANDQPMRRAS
jgi:hypothetical protein